MNFTTLTAPVILFIFVLLLRKAIDKRIKVLAHLDWCRRDLTGERRKVGELIDDRPPTHHIT